jgi:hypothetical protein
VRLIACAILLAAAFPASAAREWSFRVLLDGREIGRHAFRLAERGAERELVSEADFDVRVLLLSVYRYTHRAVERWNGDCVTGLEARTETNGDVERVDAATRAGRLVVQRESGREEHGGCVMSFAYWNPKILAEKRLLNSQTGELVPIAVQARGAEGDRRRYRLTAPNLVIDLWYAGERWVALESPAAGGRRLRYELLNEK